MPNWVSNSVRVTGLEAEVQRFIGQAKAMPNTLLRQTRTSGIPNSHSPTLLRHHRKALTRENTTKPKAGLGARSLATQRIIGITSTAESGTPSGTLARFL